MVLSYSAEASYNRRKKGGSDEICIGEPTNMLNNLTKKDIYRVLPYGGSWRFLQEAIVTKRNTTAWIDLNGNPMLEGHFHEFTVPAAALVNDAAGQVAVLDAAMRFNIDLTMRCPTPHRTTISPKRVPGLQFTACATMMEKIVPKESRIMYRYVFQVYINDEVISTGEMELSFPLLKVMKRLTKKAKEQAARLRPADMR